MHTGNLSEREWAGAFIMAQHGDQNAMMALIIHETPGFAKFAREQVCRMYPGLQEDGIYPHEVPDYDDFMQIQVTRFIEFVKKHEGRIAA